MTAVIGFGGTASAETVPTVEDIAAVAAIVDTLATGSLESGSSSSGSSGSGSSGSLGGEPEPAALPEPVAGAVAPVVTDPTIPATVVDPVPAVAPEAPTAAAPAPATGQYALPAYGILTSEFGDGRNHQGIDIAAPIGTPIFAAAGGKVINAGPAQGFGLWVRIEHEDGTITTYGHNNENVVEVGDVVLAGQQIATVGNRGDSTGPHLHFEVKLPGGKNTDPLGWLNGHGVALAQPPAATPVETQVEEPPVEVPVEAPPVPESEPALAPTPDPAIAV